MSFVNKAIIITGASSGIGAACALHFAKLSARLSLVGRHEVNLNNVAKQCEDASGLKPIVIKADLNIDLDVEKIVKDTVNCFGAIDVLVNNAGIGSLRTIRDGVKYYDDIMATNVRGAYVLTNLSVPYLIKSKGNIVNVSSVAGKKPVAKYLPYCMSKAAMDMFTKCLALDLGPEGVRVNSVNPGPVRTNIHKVNGLQDGQIEKILQYETKLSPLKKIATVEEVADLIVYLAGEKAKSITGSIHLLDNGLHLT